MEHPPKMDGFIIYDPHGRPTGKVAGVYAAFTCSILVLHENGRVACPTGRAGKLKARAWVLITMKIRDGR